MKNFTFFESTVLGFLIGVVLSTYILFVNSTGRFVGDILHWVSLTPMLNFLPSEHKDSMFVLFLFYIFISILYILVISSILRINKKIKFLFLVLILLVLTLIAIQQKKAFESPGIDIYKDVEVSQLVSVQKIKKYFGEYEVFGNLNEDDKEDVAFVIKRYAEDEGTDMYYVSSSLKEQDGYTGLNLLYLGADIVIEEILILDKKIKITYLQNEGDVEEKKEFFAEVSEKVLKEIDTESLDTSIEEN